jgi:uncharacterized repeat protein (TIGR03803 family)
MENPSLWKKACFVLVLYAATGVDSPAQTFTMLHSFDGRDGQNPVAPLVQATDGSFYGTTSGVVGGSGTVFKITPSGTLTTLHSFTGGGDGWNPLAGLVQATNGDLYGTTSGIDNDCTMPCPQPSTIFSITSDGELTTLSQSFTGDYDGGLVQASNGKFYGATPGGGTNRAGSIFEMTAGGTLTTLYSFCSQSNCTDGFGPVAALIQANNGEIYGTTRGGGAEGAGTVFRITLGGTLTTLYSFCSQGGSKCTDGAHPVAPLIQASDGNFYGTTSSNGANGHGTAFKLTRVGTLTTLYSFCSENNCVDGASPQAGLVQATDGNLFGTAVGGGNNGYGTVFKIDKNGKFTTLYNFCSQSGCTDGANPYAALTQGTDGNLYGTTESGGLSECRAPHIIRNVPCGTVFSLSVGLFPFVKALPDAGEVGAEIGILGTDLSGANGVTFNGTIAQFKVVSSSLILAHVPAGASTGEVEVHFWPAHYFFSSNVPFFVLK